MNCFSGPELESKFLSEFDCQPYVSGKLKESRKRRQTRETAQGTLEVFKAVRARVTTKEDAFAEVEKQTRKNQRTSMGPIGIFIFWSIFGALIQKMTFWLWDHATIELHE